MAENNHNFPWKHIIGFIFSIALTLLAVWGALYTDFATNIKIWFIVFLAILQAGVQLIMFMHIREGESMTQIITMLYSAFIGIVIVGGSIWVINAMMHSHHM
ncbi:cytochrome aa3 quinol oxidase subunit IV [Pontibacillus litoralis]|uniref:Quinol oxidase subunit 4 n=1 Tax=Pontibacillus litoralis JSM 072002 TaxID=1385512 RepID=A0A0A5G6P1_9BACI|nr:cytochrome aa3 quinol oxidase subunit IV [Pontibacillus litoralis]KGX88796.1 quinol oxidase subunit 4 [Pontibacillus litoralis JSM 072002]